MKITVLLLIISASVVKLAPTMRNATNPAEEDKQEFFVDADVNFGFAEETGWRQTLLFCDLTLMAVGIMVTACKSKRILILKLDTTRHVGRSVLLKKEESSTISPPIPSRLYPKLPPRNSSKAVNT